MKGTGLGAGVLVLVAPDAGRVSSDNEGAAKLAGAQELRRKLPIKTISPSFFILKPLWGATDVGLKRAVLAGDDGLVTLG